MKTAPPPYSELLETQGSLSLFRNDRPVPYPVALEWMERRVAAIAAGEASEAIWLLEHPPLYTAGTSARIEDLIQPDRFPVYNVGRGGEYTYHGPGQRVAYVLINLNNRGRDIRAFVKQLEGWIIATLANFGIRGEIREGRVGVWVETGEDFLGRPQEAKIAAVGIRVRKWVTFHGIAINQAPNLEHFTGIVPCGLSQFGVTSLEALGCESDLHALDKALIASLPF